jgi:isoquinoline 1-oxidoreductase subunit alpha
MQRVKLTSETSGRNSMISLKVNGLSVEANAMPNTPLLWVLRDHLGLTGTKFGCGIGQCGASTVHLDGNPVRSCVLPISAVKGEITTIEAVGETAAGKRVQAACLSLEAA